MSLEAWMRIGQPLEPVMHDYARIFDAWSAGGVRGLVFGRLLFEDDHGQFTVPAFPSSPQVYRDRGMEPYADRQETDPVKERLLHAMLDDARARGWTILIFAPGAGATGATPLPLEQDPYRAIHMAAVWDETFRAFPQVDGGIMDGWTESAYELTYHHGNAVFRDLSDMELGFPLAFFEQVVTRETARAIAAVRDPKKIVPWVDTGRLPHGGDPMTAGDLYRILTASESAGLQRFLFHNHTHLTAAEWCVISRLCGIPWDEDPSGYWPPNTPKPSTY